MKLDRREREVLERFYGLNGHERETRAAIAKHWGVTPKAVGYVKARALKHVVAQLAPPWQRTLLRSPIGRPNDATFESQRRILKKYL